MNYDLTKLGLSEEELFSRVEHDDTDSEKIAAPRYSYWKSVFRVFFKNKVNIIVLSVLAVLILFAYIYFFIWSNVLWKDGKNSCAKIWTSSNSLFSMDLRSFSSASQNSLFPAFLL